MAITYWDNGVDGTASTTTSDIYLTCATTSTATSTTTTATTTDTNCYRIPPRQVVVRHPANWSRDVTDAYVRLVNEETNTGWKVTMLISGDIAIVDPTIDVRSMAGFRSLLKWRASTEDRKTIDAFFDQHGAGEA